MREIYPEATRAAIDLGDHDDNTELAERISQAIDEWRDRRIKEEQELLRINEHQEVAVRFK